MFQAGRTVARSSSGASLRLRVWPIAAVALGAIALGEAGWIGFKSDRVIERVVVRDAASAAPAERAIPSALVREAPASRSIVEPTDDASGPVSGYRAYARLRREVALFGIDALPEPGALAAAGGGGMTQSPSASPPSAASLRAEINSILNLE